MFTCDPSLSQHVRRKFPRVTSRDSRRCVVPKVYSVTQSKSSGQHRRSQHNFTILFPLAKINLRINTVATSSNHHFVPSMDKKQNVKTFALFSQFWARGAFARRRGQCDNLKIKWSLATPWKKYLPQVETKWPGDFAPPPTHTHNFRFQPGAFAHF
jgi:hypothetical protein